MCAFKGERATVGRARASLDWSSCLTAYKTSARSHSTLYPKVSQSVRVEGVGERQPFVVVYWIPDVNSKLSVRCKPTGAILGARKGVLSERYKRAPFRVRGDLGAAFLGECCSLSRVKCARLCLSPRVRVSMCVLMSAVIEWCSLWGGSPFLDFFFFKFVLNFGDGLGHSITRWIGTPKLLEQP